MVKDLNKLTMAQLRQKLQESGLETSGNKVELVKRLEAHTDGVDAPLDKIVQEPGEQVMPEEVDMIDEQVNENPSMFDDEELNTSANGVEDAQAENTSKQTPEQNSEAVVVNLNKLSVDELQAEILKRQASVEAIKESQEAPKQSTSTDRPKATQKKVKWATIMDGQSDDKLLKELKRLDMMAGFRSRPKVSHTVSCPDVPVSARVRRTRADTDILAEMSKHRISLYPLTPEEFSNPVMLDMLSKCRTAVYKLYMQPDGKSAGIVDLNFRLLSDVTDAIPVLSKLQDNLHIHHSGMNLSKKEWNIQMKQDSNIFTGSDSDKRSVFLPSLQSTVTEEMLFDLFPQAAGIWLVKGVIRNHAYVSFHNVEDVTEAIKLLNQQGPTKDNIKFCGMLTFTRMQELMAKDNQEAQKAAKQPAKPSTKTAAPHQMGNKQGVKKAKKAKKGLQWKNRNQGGPVGKKSGPQSSTSQQFRNPQGAGKRQNSLNQQQGVPGGKKQKKKIHAPPSGSAGKRGHSPGGAVRQNPSKMRRTSGGDYAPNGNQHNSSQDRKQPWKKYGNSRDSQHRQDIFRKPWQHESRYESWPDFRHEPQHDFRHESQHDFRHEPQHDFGHEPQHDFRHEPQHDFRHEPQHGFRHEPQNEPRHAPSYEPRQEHGQERFIPMDTTTGPGYGHSVMAHADLSPMYRSTPYAGVPPGAPSSEYMNRPPVTGQTQDKLSAAMETLNKLNRLRNTTLPAQDYGMGGPSMYRGDTY